MTENAIVGDHTDVNLDYATAHIEADREVPMIRTIRDFRAPVASVMRAHTDPELYAAWVGPDAVTTTIGHWDARSGGSWEFSNHHDGERYDFRGCFHRITDDTIVQTFTFEAMPDDVSLETLRLIDLGDGRTRLIAQSLVDSFAGRDAWLASGMEIGINEGYAKLDRMLVGSAA